MLVIVQGETQDIKVTTVVLEADPLHPDVLSMFHCSSDGKALFQYSGELVMLMPGGTKATVPFIVHCRLCKRRYLINSIV